MKRACAAAAILAIAACRSAQPVPPKPAAAAPGSARARTGSSSSSAPAIQDDAAAVADAAWQARAQNPAGLDRAIATWEDLALRTLDPAELLLKAARARRLRVDERVRAAVTASDSDEALGSAAPDALACAADAHRAWMARFPAAAAQLDGTREAAAIYAQVGAPAAEALYLEAVCTAAWARTQGFTQLIERRAELEEELKRAAALAPDLDGAGPLRELGSLLAALPAYAGGDLRSARAQLEAAVERAPQDPRNRLQLARTVAVKAQDRALFSRLLQEVAKSEDAQSASDAAALLAREDELFGPAQAAQPTPGGTQK